MPSNGSAKARIMARRAGGRLGAAVEAAEKEVRRYPPPRPASGKPVSAAPAANTPADPRKIPLPPRACHGKPLSLIALRAASAKPHSTTFGGAESCNAIGGSKIPPPHIDVTDRHRHHHHREGVQRVSDELERHLVALADAGDRQVGRGADQRAVAAEAGAERQAPPQRLDVVGAAEGRRHVLDQRDHGGDERNVVDDRRQHRRGPQDGVAGGRELAAGRRHQLVGEQREQAADVDAVHHHEQADEEEDGDPLHVAEGLVDIVRGLLGVMRPVVEQHQNGGAEHGDGGRLQMQRPRQHEGDHDDGEHGERLLEQHPVLDRIRRIHRHHPRLGVVRRLEILAPEEMDDQRLHHHDDDDHRRQVIDEIVEGEADLRADQDVGRIADQGGGAADIGGEDFREQIRVGRDLQRAADGERHRHDQQHRGDVVEEGREHGGGDLQDEQDAGRDAPSPPSPTTPPDTGTCRSGARSTPGSSCR